jgi:hypothetical protein
MLSKGDGLSPLVSDVTLLPLPPGPPPPLDLFIPAAWLLTAPSSRGLSLVLSHLIPVTHAVDHIYPHFALNPSDLYICSPPSLSRLP